MIDKFIPSFSFLVISVTAKECWMRLSGDIKSIISVKCVGCGISLAKTGQWIKPERIAVNLRITRVYTELFEFVALLRALALGGDPTLPS